MFSPVSGRIVGAPIMSSINDALLIELKYLCTRMYRLDNLNRIIFHVKMECLE